MDCRDFDSYTDECPEVATDYVCIAKAIADEPSIMPTAEESAALALALSNVGAREHVRVERQSVGLLVAASALAFVLVAAMMSLVVFRVISFELMLDRFNPVAMMLAGTIIIFVTTFVPIAATARRRPLNGMTFRG